MLPEIRCKSAHFCRVFRKSLLRRGLLAPSEPERLQTRGQPRRTSGEPSERLTQRFCLQLGTLGAGRREHRRRRPSFPHSSSRRRRLRRRPQPAGEPDLAERRERLRAPARRAPPRRSRARSPRSAPGSSIAHAAGDVDEHVGARRAAARRAARARRRSSRAASGRRRSRRAAASRGRSARRAPGSRSGAAASPRARR